MATKPVRPWNPRQPTLLPTDLQQWLPSTHLVWFILDVIDRLDLGRFTEALNRKDPRGMVPYDPRMMAAMLMYAYSVGVFSSRRIERATEANVAGAVERGFDPHIAPERTRHRRYEVPGAIEPPPTDEGLSDALPATSAVNGAPTEPPPPTPREAMRAKLKTDQGAAIYAKRKTTPEPVFGQLLHVRGFRRFSLRGLEKVRGEWSLVSLTHNLLKAWRSGLALPEPA